MTWRIEIPDDRNGQSETIASMLHDLVCIGGIIEALGEHVDELDPESIRWLGQRVRDCAGEAVEARNRLIDGLQAAVGALFATPQLKS